MRPVVYLAHPVGAATAEGVRANLARAKRWLWALRSATEWSICAPWIPSVEAALDASVAEVEERKRGIPDSLAVVERCDAIVLVGGRMSSGMAVERDHAAACGVAVVDLTDFGEEPPGPDAVVGAGVAAGLVAVARMAIATIERAARSAG